MKPFSASKRRSKLMATSAMALALTIGGGLLSGSSAFADTTATDSSTSAAVAPQAGAGHGGKFGHGGGMFAGKGGIQAYLDKLTAYLKLDEATLKEKLKTESLADIAAEQNISRDDLKAQLTAWIQDAIANAGAATGTASGTATDSGTATTRPALDPSAIADKLLDAKGGQGGRMGQGGGFGYDQAAVATALGVTEDDLKTALSSGKTLADIATEKGVDTQTVIDAITKSITAKLDEALAAGKITQTQHDDQVAAAAKTAEAIVNGKFGGGMKGGFGKGGGFDADTIAAAIGVTTDELKAAIATGQTIGAYAESKSVAAQTVVDALTKSQQDKLNQQLADGKITLDQYNQQVDSLSSRIDAIVHGDAGGHGAKGGQGLNVDDSIIAAAIGVTEDDLRAAFKNGQTVSELAQSKGVATETVVEAIAASMTKQLDQLLSDGKITQDEYMDRYNKISGQIGDILSSKGSRGGRHGHGFHNRDGAQSLDDQTTSTTDSSNT